MANAFVKPERVVSTMVGVLQRELVLARLVTRNLGGDFAGAKDDTIKVKIRANAVSRKRGLRSAAALTADDLTQSFVSVTLDQHIYNIAGVTLAELTLDVENFEEEVASPVAEAVAIGVEDEVIAEMEGATYEASHTLVTNATDPYLTLIDAGTVLDKSRVPTSGRFLAVGSDAKEALLKSDRLSNVNTAGNGDALYKASLGEIAGFTAVSVPGLDPGMMVAGHSTAFALGMKSPVVPSGAVAGAGRSWDGFSMTAIQDYDHDNATDRFGAHTFVGTATVEDSGTIDADGIFTPDPTRAADSILVRAVKMELA